MPLRLLERVMPWLMTKLSDSDAAKMMTSFKLGAPKGDATLVELLSRWAERGRGGSPDSPGNATRGERPAAAAAAARWYRVPAATS